ncbi:MAG: hypothetical protein ACREVZ_01290 [Burkholderiales bacterium]
MMVAQTDPELLTWLLNAQRKAGGFVATLAEAAMRADHENYPILRPVLVQMREKYPQYSEGEDE